MFVIICFFNQEEAKRTKQLVPIYIPNKESAHVHTMSLTNGVSTRLVGRDLMMLKKEIQK
jgi:hypothetical protein